MLLQEAFNRERKAERGAIFVSQIRGSMNSPIFAELVKYLKVSDNNCQSVIDTIKAHPDWSDEQVAEEIYWDD